MTVERWWDEPELVLLAHTGDVALAEQFAAWCKQSTAALMDVTGASEDEVNEGASKFMRDGGATP